MSMLFGGFRKLGAAFFMLIVASQAAYSKNTILMCRWERSLLASKEANLIAEMYDKRNPLYLELDFSSSQAKAPEGTNLDFLGFMTLDQSNEELTIRARNTAFKDLKDRVHEVLITINRFSLTSHLMFSSFSDKRKMMETHFIRTGDCIPQQI